MSFTLHLSSFTRKQLYRRLQQAYASGSLRLIKRIHVLLALAQDQSVSDVAEMLAVGEQTVRDYRNQYLFKGMASLVYQAPPGRPSKLTKTQRQHRRFAHFSLNLLKSLDRGFEELASSPLEFVEYKGLIKMTEPRVNNSPNGSKRARKTQAIPRAAGIHR